MRPLEELSECVKRLTALLPAMRLAPRSVRPLIEEYQLAHTLLWERCDTYRMAVEFLMTTLREGDQWIYLDGQAVDPPEKLKACLDEIQVHLDAHRKRLS
jgi:hypothetical protein